MASFPSSGLPAVPTVFLPVAGHACPFYYMPWAPVGYQYQPVDPHLVQWCLMNPMQQMAPHFQPTSHPIPEMPKDTVVTAPLMNSDADDFVPPSQVPSAEPTPEPLPISSPVKETAKIPEIVEAPTTPVENEPKKRLTFAQRTAQLKSRNSVFRGTRPEILGRGTEATAPVVDRAIQEAPVEEALLPSDVQERFRRLQQNRYRPVSQQATPIALSEECARGMLGLRPVDDHNVSFGVVLAAAKKFAGSKTLRNAQIGHGVSKCMQVVDSSSDTRFLKIVMKRFDERSAVITAYYHTGCERQGCNTEKPSIRTDRFTFHPSELD